MTNLSDKDLYIESSLHIHRIATREGNPRTGYSLRRSRPLDPTTAAAMRLAQLRAEERVAVSRGDTAALQEIARSIVRELAWEKA
jgi:hypothetical protein